MDNHFFNYTLNFNWDYNLLDVRLYSGTEGCIDVIEKSKRVKTDKCSVTLSLLSIDIPKNIYFIKGWLMSNK
jgi:hypothetical protein